MFALPIGIRRWGGGGEEEEEEEEEEGRNIKELLGVYEMVTSCGYLSREASAGRVNIDILEAYL